jgi:hypothetical protein
VIEPVLKAEALEASLCPVGGFTEAERGCGSGAGVGGCDAGREGDILQGAELREEVVELEDEAERAVAHVGALGVGELPGVDALDQDAALGGTLEEAQNVEECGLASP